MRGGIAALRLPFGLPFGREHFVVANPAERWGGKVAAAWRTARLAITNPAPDPAPLGKGWGGKVAAAWRTAAWWLQTRSAGFAIRPHQSINIYNPYRGWDCNGFILWRKANIACEIIIF